MEHNFINDQVELAEQFVLMNTLTNQASYEAILKIKRWKLIARIAGIEKRFLREADVKIRNAFLSYIPNVSLLLQEGYFFTNNEN